MAALGETSFTVLKQLSRKHFDDVKLLEWRVPTVHERPMLEGGVYTVLVEEIVG